MNPPQLLFSLARIAWLALVALSLGMLVVGVPAAYHQILAVCADGTCYDWQLSPEAARRLEESGIPASAYATYFIVFRRAPQPDLLRCGGSDLPAWFG